jgi:hypothetical protein
LVAISACSSARRAGSSKPSMPKFLTSRMAIAIAISGVNWKPASGRCGSAPPGAR